MGERTYFDVFAADYDEFVAAMPDVHPHVEDVLVQLSPPRRVLDLGAGTGRTSALVARVFPEAEIDLVDASSEMLARVTTSSVHPHVADVDEFLDSGTDAYDLVVSVAVVELLPDLDATVARIARRLTPAGAFVFTHEPLVHGAAVQGRRRHVVDLEDAQLSVTRRDLDEVTRAVEAAGLRAELSRLIPGLTHADGVGVYHLVVARPEDSRHDHVENVAPAPSPV
jgi:trans-aconitate methyltransferase